MCVCDLLIHRVSLRQGACVSLFLIVRLNWFLSLFVFVFYKYENCWHVKGQVTPSVGDHASFIQCAVIDRNMTLYASSLDVIGYDKAV